MFCFVELSVKGLGYYHLHTRESYQIILKRVVARRDKAELIASLSILCVIILVCAPCGIAIRKDRLERKAYFDNMIKVITLRMNAAGPSTDIDIPEDILQQMKDYVVKRKGNNDRYNDHYYYTHGDCFVDDCGAACG